MTVFYYDKEKAEQGILFCLGQEDKILTQEEMQEQGKEKLYENAVTYTGESVLVGYPIVERDTIRKATDKELIDKGIVTLGDGEILEGDTIKKVPQPSWQYKWVSPNWVIDESKLQDGEIAEDGVIKTIPIPCNILRPKWEYPEWVESDTKEEIVEAYDVLIDGLKEEIRDDGFIYTEKKAGTTPKTETPKTFSFDEVDKLNDSLKNL